MAVLKLYASFGEFKGILEIVRLVQYYFVFLELTVTTASTAPARPPDVSEMRGDMVFFLLR